MAYIPTINDIHEVHEKQSYQPSISDIHEVHANAQEQQKPEQSFLSKLPRDIAAGAGQFAQNIYNTPYNWANTQKSSNPVMNALRAIQGPGLSISASERPNMPHMQQDFNKTFGIQNPDWKDKLVQGLTSAAPFMLGGTSLPALATQGVLHGATSENPQHSALLGGGIGATLGAIPGMYQAGKQGIKNLLQAEAPGRIAEAGAQEARPFAEAIAPLRATHEALTAQTPEVKNKPYEIVESIRNLLGGGASTSENRQALAAETKSLAENAKKSGVEEYNKVFSKVGNESIYPEIVKQPKATLVNILGEPLSKVKQESRGILDMPESKLKHLNEYNELFSKFKENPTAENAHWLQSQLGYETRNLEDRNKKGLLDLAEKRQLRALSDIKNQLQGDLNSFLDKKGLQKEYKGASENWNKNVAPWNTGKIAEVSSGFEKEPTNIKTIYGSTRPNIENIRGKLPEESKNRVLYDALKAVHNKDDPQAWLNELNKIDEKRLSPYLSPKVNELKQSLKKSIDQVPRHEQVVSHLEKIMSAHEQRATVAAKELENKVQEAIAKNKKLTGHLHHVLGGGLGALTGYEAGGHYGAGAGATGAIAGAFGGKAIAPSLIKLLEGNPLLSKIGRGTSNVIGNTYGPASQIGLGLGMSSRNQLPQQ